jgi:high affinity Mn2+ porin
VLTLHFALCLDFVVSSSAQTFGATLFDRDKAALIRSFDNAFLLGGTTTFQSPPGVLVALRESNTHGQNETGSLDKHSGGSFNFRSSGVPVALIGQEGIRCVAPLRRQDNSGADPATVCGESFSDMPLALAMQGLGRRRRVRTREPGDLPERSHLPACGGTRTGRTSAVVTSRIVTRKEAATMLARILRNKIANIIIAAAFAAAGVAALAGEAAADDAIVTKAPTIPFTGPAYNWNGFYAGGHFGVAWGNSNWNAGPGISGSNNLFQPINSWDEAGSFFAGLQGGYNYMLPNRILLGNEADATFPAFQPLPVGVNPFGVTIGGTSNFTSPTLGAVSFAETVLSSGTVRGRIGYAPGHWLFYATGGFAWTYNQQSLTQVATGNSATPFLWRLGWTAGAGVEVPIAPHWTARVEYLFKDYGRSTTNFFGTQAVSSDFLLNEVRFGLNYQFGNGAVPASAPIVTKAPAASDPDYLSLHGQGTFVWQGYPAYRSPFSGTNSLVPAGGAGRETVDLTLFAGLRLWQGAELWFNPEIDQGHGLAETHGVAGFPSGEAYKLGFDYPYTRVNRYFVRQTIDLGGDTQKVDSDINLFAQSYTANRLVFWVGKFSVVDVFDTNKYANNPKTDFLNWSLINAGTFDYAGDAWGYTYGGAVEWYQGIFAVRAGVFDLSATPAGGGMNAPAYGLDETFSQQQYVAEIEERHEIWGQPGKVKVTAFVSHGRAGDFQDAINLSQPGQPFAGNASDALASVRTYRNRTGVSLNIEQQATETIGVFLRAGWADGAIEPWDFTDIDRTVSGGVSIGGKNWGRPDDTIGIAGVINGLAPVHQAYFAAGGNGILIGDGALPNYGLEGIFEAYYSYAITSWLKMSVDYQFIANPGYNADRGPVNVFAGRIHTTF